MKNPDNNEVSTFSSHSFSDVDEDDKVFDKFNIGQIFEQNKAGVQMDQVHEYVQSQIQFIFSAIDDGNVENNSKFEAYKIVLNEKFKSLKNQDEL